jgi:hypothetical protein
VRYLADGTLEFLGRVDHQVKVRGFRIEPGEVEGAMRLHPAVREAVVVVHEARLGDPQLVAYVVPASSHLPTTNEQSEDAELSSFVVRRSSFVAKLRDFLTACLPSYMLPAAFVLLDALPLTPNGKLDRRALPVPDSSARSAAEAAFVAPETPVECKLAAIWSQVLKRELVGVHDNFFALGGHSLLAGQIIYRINEAFHVDLPLRRLFQEPTIAELALSIEELWVAEVESLSETDMHMQLA